MRPAANAMGQSPIFLQTAPASSQASLLPQSLCLAQDLWAADELWELACDYVSRCERNGSVADISVDRTGLFAGKPAPTEFVFGTGFVGC
jgi:hypothetical protein